jgi:hypothetical protein
MKFLYQYNPGKIILISLISAAFIAYPNISFLPWELSFMDDAAKLKHIYFFTFRYLIRANKQFIIARESVIKITVWFDNRLLVALDVEVPERIFISKNRALEFKEWLVNT